MFDFLPWRKKQYPEWVQTYFDLKFIPPNAGFEDHPFVVLDCETTGLSSSDDLITLGAIKCSHHEIKLTDVLDQRYSLESSGSAAEIHGELRNHELIPEKAHLESLVQFLGAHIIVGHNIAFDIAMINKKLQSRFGFRLKNKVLDTAKLAIRLDPEKYERAVGGQSNLHLDDLCNLYRIPIENRHTALGDAYLTALLFQRLLQRLKKRGITNLRDLSK